MSAASVKSAILKALQTKTAHGTVNQTEAKAITAAVVGSNPATAVVAPSEVELLRQLMNGDSFDGGPASYSLSAPARAVLDAFVTSEHLPIGTNEAALRSQIETQLGGLQLSPLSKAPSTSNLVPMTLSDARPSDGALREALINPTKGEYYLRTTSQGRGQPTPTVSYFGPVKFDAASPTQPTLPRDQLNTQLRAQLSAATDGVLFPSESDFPFDVMLLPNAGQTKPTPAQFKAAAGLSAGTHVSSEAVSTLFKPFATMDMGSPDFDDAQKATAQKLLQLRDLMTRQLTDVQVFRTGSSGAIGIYIMGRNAYGDLVGVHTTSVET